MRFKRFSWTAMVLVSVGCSTLRPRRDPKPFVPPPMEVRTMPADVPIIGEPAPVVGGIYADLAEISAPNLGRPMQLPERPPAPPPRPRTPPAPQPPVEPPVEAPPPQPVQVPKLTRIISEEEARKLRGEVDVTTRTAEQIVDAAARRTLNGTQSTLATQVRTFIKQAREQTDLVAAANLAGRALILARDLERTIR
jgi:hypothetical protein